MATESAFENMYHCCAQKTASQWFKAVFSDRVFYKYTGLEVFTHRQLVDQKVRMDGPVPYAQFRDPIPPRTVGSPLYLGYLAYLTLPKPGNFRAFFVTRDPRDITISWYFSARYSHDPAGMVAKFRRDLEDLDLSQGLMYGIDALEDTGLYSVLRSWSRVHDDDKVRIFRYEDLARDNEAFLRGLLSYLAVSLPEAEFAAMYERNKFATLAGGRVQGQEVSTDHYRKGLAGDWTNHFDRSVEIHFRNTTGDLTEQLGYE